MFEESSHKNHSSVNMNVFFGYFPTAALVINKARCQATTNMVLKFINELNNGVTHILLFTGNGLNVLKFSK